MEKLLESLIKLYSQLTLKHTLLWALLMACSLAGWIGYTHADDLYLAVMGPARTASSKNIVPAPSGKLLKELKTFVDNSNTLLAISVVDVDLMRNTRNTVWFYSANPTMTAAFERFQRQKVGDTAWFNADKEQDTRNVALIHGGAYCLETPKISTFKAQLPEFYKLTAMNCVVAVPPTYGEFSGYLSFWFHAVLTEEEQARAIATMRDFSSRIK